MLDGRTVRLHVYALSRLGEMSASAALGALRSQAEYAAESAVDVVHEGGRKEAGSCLEVCLVECDQGGDIDD